MKFEKILAVIWLIFSSWFFFQGFHYIYKYSTPGALWFSMVPIIVAYSNIVFGILTTIIGLILLNQKIERYIPLLPLSFSLIIYIIVAIAYYGIDNLFYIGESFILLMLLGLSAKFLNKKVGLKTLINRMKTKIVLSIGIVLSVFIPYWLTILTRYDSYYFLH